MTMRMSGLAFLLFIFFTSDLAPEMQGRAPASQIPTVCTLTLNSSDEKKVFEQVLKPVGFRFRELLPEKKEAVDSREWLSRACRDLEQEKVSCDIVLISGHFGGDLFFGVQRDSGLRLFMDDLQKHSCENSCQALLGKAAHVFLMGCNTLAGKDPDHRSQEDYVQVLRADGVGELDAHRIAQARYGPFSQNFRDQMRQVFFGSTQLLGFHSVSPAGARVAPALRAFLKAVEAGDPARLKSALLERSSSGENSSVARSYLRVLNQYGFLAASARGIDSHSKEQIRKIRENVCTLRDSERWYSERMDFMAEWMRTEDALAYLPTLMIFFRQWPPELVNGGLGYADPREQSAWMRLSQARPRGYLEATQQQTMGFSRFQWMLLGYQMGWISLEQGISEMKRSLSVLWKRRGARLDSDTVDFLCQVAPSLPIAFREWVESRELSHLRSSRPHYPRLIHCLKDRSAQPHP